MIDFENIRVWLKEQIKARKIYGGSVPTSHDRAVVDFEKMVKLIESLPVFEDTGERFVPCNTKVYGVNYDNEVVDVIIGFKVDRWWGNANGKVTYQFYSTKAAAEAAMKGKQNGNEKN